MTSKQIIQKKIIKYLIHKHEALEDKIDIKLQYFEDEIPRAQKPPIVPKQNPNDRKNDQCGKLDYNISESSVMHYRSQSEDDTSTFTTLKYFYKFIRNKYRDALVNQDVHKIHYFKQYIRYMEEVQFKIERFVQREMIKLKIIQNAAGTLGGSEDSRIQYQGNQIKDRYHAEDYVIFDNDIAQFKHSSYKAEDLDCITDLPLSQLYIFREQIARQ